MKRLIRRDRHRESGDKTTPNWNLTERLSRIERIKAMVKNAGNKGENLTKDELIALIVVKIGYSHREAVSILNDLITSSELRLVDGRKLEAMK
jgi:hypothetical protein